MLPEDTPALLLTCRAGLWGGALKCDPLRADHKSVKGSASLLTGSSLSGPGRPLLTNLGIARPKEERIETPATWI